MVMLIVAPANAYDKVWLDRPGATINMSTLILISAYVCVPRSETENNRQLAWRYAFYHHSNHILCQLSCFNFEFVHIRALGHR